MIKKGALLTLIMTLVACGTVPNADLLAQTASPALLASNNSSQCHQELTIRLSEVMAKPVTVSASAFARESRLFLDAASLRQHNQMSLAKPKVFNLLVLNQQCLLADEQNKQIPLNLCVCQPVN